MIVLDASATVDLLADRNNAGWVEGRLLDGTPDLVAPQLLDVEVLSGLRGLALAGLLPPKKAKAALERFGDLGVTLYPHQPLLDRAWQLRDRLTAYDAVYLVLAEVLEAPLLTTDGRLARTAKRYVPVLTPVG